ncbi:hypothetical protein ABBQ38_012903 [Trebouxia sp. C0009 RCD-2024]
MTALVSSDCNTDTLATIELAIRLSLVSVLIAGLEIMSASVMQMRCTATLHRNLVNPTLRPRTPYGRTGRRTLDLPLQAQKIETSNNNSKDITETGGKVCTGLHACDNVAVPIRAWSS